MLQDLRYAYDPVGNVLSVRNDAEATRFWRNQKVVPENTYAYDSLYQLVSATGREMADPGATTRYTRRYTYDTAGNLSQIRHSAPATNHSYTTDITISARSNRAVLSTWPRIRPRSRRCSAPQVSKAAVTRANPCLDTARRVAPGLSGEARRRPERS